MSILRNTLVALLLVAAPAALAGGHPAPAIGGEEGWIPIELTANAYGGEEGWRPTEGGEPGNAQDTSAALTAAWVAPGAGSFADGLGALRTDMTQDPVVAVDAVDIEETAALTTIEICGDIPVGGLCDGDVLTWCDADGTVTSEDCSLHAGDQACGWDSSNGYFGCVGYEAAPQPLGTWQPHDADDLLPLVDGAMAGCSGGGGGTTSLLLAGLALLLAVALRRPLSA